MTKEIDLDALERLAKAVEAETSGVDDAAEWVACAPQYVLALIQRVREAEGALSADAERLRAAESRVWPDGPTHGCDAADWLAEEVLSARAALREAEAERDEALKELPTSWQSGHDNA